MVAWLFLWTCAEHDCSLQRSGQVLWRDVTTKPFWMYARRWDVSRIVTTEAAAVWTVWLLVQVRHHRAQRTVSTLDQHITY